ncbi:unnamed protein product [Sympodiomycopsis kandeliae]
MGCDEIMTFATTTPLYQIKKSSSQTQSATASSSSSTQGPSQLQPQHIKAEHIEKVTANGMRFFGFKSNALRKDHRPPPSQVVPLFIDAITGDFLNHWTLPLPKSSPFRLEDLSPEERAAKTKFIELERREEQLARPYKVKTPKPRRNRKDDRATAC